MGAAESRVAGEQFEQLYAELPPEVRERIAALAAPGSEILLKPHASAPPPFPKVPIGVAVRLQSDVAQAALALVPRLQRKHHELTPRSLSETEFWCSFFSHVTAIIGAACPAALSALDEPAWKGVDARAETNGFDAAWAGLSDAKKAAVAALADRDSDVLAGPCLQAPAAFPPLPLGVEAFVDERAATAALASVPGLQSKHYLLVPKKVDEKAFWANFFTHMTVAAGEGGAAYVVGV